MRRLIGLVAVVLALDAGVAHAQNRSAERAATAVAQQFFNAMSEKRWDDAARLLDLDAFAVYRKSFIANAKRMPPAERPPTVEEIMQHDPKMPREVAEYFARQTAEVRGHDSFNYVAFDFADVPTIDSLASLPVGVAASRWLHAKDPVLQMRQMNGTSSCKEVLGAYLKQPRNIILATAVADSEAYVVYEQNFGVLGEYPAANDRPLHGQNSAVLLLHRRAGRWFVQPATLPSGPEIGSGIDCSITRTDSSSTKKHSN